MNGERVTQKKILLADDQTDVRQTVSLLLSLDKHKVTEACNGLEALELFQKGTFDLVITDYAMPGLRGDQLAQRVKQLCPAQPVLMITGSVEASTLASGCVDQLLNKPFTLDGLRQAVASLLLPVAVRAPLVSLQLQP
jgi:CheY-like chemotaxis protein